MGGPAGLDGLMQPWFVDSMVLASVDDLSDLLWKCSESQMGQPVKLQI